MLLIGTTALSINVVIAISGKEAHRASRTRFISTRDPWGTVIITLGKFDPIGRSGIDSSLIRNFAISHA